MPNKTIKLAEPIKGHDGDIRAVVLREPRASDLFALGEPIVYAQTASGMFFTSEKEETIRAYLDRCIVEPSDKLLLEQLSLRDGIQVKEALLGFFMDARQGPSPDAATSSSSTSKSSTPKAAET